MINDLCPRESSSYLSDLTLKNQENHPGYLSPRELERSPGRYSGYQSTHNELVGGWATPLKNMKVNGKDYPIWKKNVANHQPDEDILWDLMDANLDS